MYLKFQWVMYMIIYNLSNKLVNLIKKMNKIVNSNLMKRKYNKIMKIRYLYIKKKV